VEEDKSLGVRRGNNAYRVYKFLDEKRIRKPSVKKEKGTTGFCLDLYTIDQLIL
jgi:hypothetical protein